MTTTCTRRLEFDAGHRVPLHESKCKTPHGHRYKVDITCEADELTPEGFVVDFGIIKQFVGNWIDEFWDHTFIYQTGDGLMHQWSDMAKAEGLRTFYEMSAAPTAENMAEHLFRVATNLLTHDDDGKPADYGLKVVSVVVHETPNCSAEYRP